jgi:hypothetical protein
MSFPVKGTELARKVRLDLAARWTAAERRYLAAEHVSADSAEAAQTALDTGRENCKELKDYSGSQLVAYLIDSPPDKNAIKYLCPKYGKALAEAGRGFSDGTYAVGQEIKAGTYHTMPDVHDCYWERTTKHGATIANDFVSYAPKGVVVTIRSTDGGFKSDSCGPWLHG